jgi:type IX secretion system PorP/SprF family membrane protein
MRKTVLSILLLITALLFTRKGMAQDPTYSQYNFNQLYYNPAYTGYHYGYQLQATYRTLWPNAGQKSFPGPLSTYHAWFDGFVNIRNVFHAGIGAFAMQDVEGDGSLTTSSFGISYAQHLPKIGFKTDAKPRIRLSVGFKAYFNSIFVDWDRFVFTDQLNIDYGILGSSAFGQQGTVRRNYFDLDAGLLLQNNFMGRDKWYNELGFSVGHVLAPSISLTGSTEDRTRLPRKYVASYRSTVALARGKLFTGPTILFENQANFFALNTGLDFFIKPSNKTPVVPLTISIMNRLTVIQNKINTSAMIVGISHKGRFGTRADAPIYYIGFAADFPYMGLGMQTAGAYELSIGIIIPRRGSMVIPCPFGAFDHDKTVNNVYRRGGSNR